MEKAIVSEATKTSGSWLERARRKISPPKPHFYNLLEEQAGIVRAAAQKLAELSVGDRLVIATAVRELEHQGNTVKAKMEEALADTFVTPIDREDLQTVSAKIDKVLDKMKSAAISFRSFAIARPTSPMLEMIAVLGRMTVFLEQAVATLHTHDYQSVKMLARQVRALESEGDRIYEDALAALSVDPAVDAKRLLCESRVLLAIETALDNAEILGDVLFNTAVKHE